VRAFSFIGNFILHLLSLYFFPLTSQLYFFTQIGNNMVWVSSALSFYLGSRTDSKVSFSMLKATAVITELALVMQLLITIVYWIALH